MVLKQFKMRAGFSTEEVGLFREAFDEADRSGDGSSSGESKGEIGFDTTLEGNRNSFTDQ